MDAVRILRSEKEAQLTFDPMKREILRLLASKALTGANLSRITGLSAPTVGHHLESLRKAGLAEIVKSEAGKHGIVQKFYRSTAQVFVIEPRRLSPQVKRYLMPTRLERTRGMMAALSLLGNDGHFKPSSVSLEKATEALTLQVLEAAEKRQGQGRTDDAECLVCEIYREALGNLLKTRPEFFPQVQVILAK